MRAAVLASMCFATVGAVAWFAGCGSNIESAGTMGTGGHGGATVGTGTTVVSSSVGTGGVPPVSSNVSTATTTSVSVTTSSSTGGVDMACQAACDHIDMCMLGFSCQNVMGFFNCNNINNADDCLFNCVASTPCSQIQMQGFGLFQTCMAMCNDGGMASSTSSGFVGSSTASSSSGGMGNTCQGCSLQHCGGPVGACAQNQACLAWLMCVQPCNQAMPPDPACFAACDTANAGASSLYDAVYACSCSKCTSQCGSIPECAVGGSDAGSGDGGP